MVEISQGEQREHSHGGGEGLLERFEALLTYVSEGVENALSFHYNKTMRPAGKAQNVGNRKGDRYLSPSPFLSLNSKS